MLFKWFFIGAIIGFIIGLFTGGGFAGAIGTAVIFGGLSVAFRKWIMRTFWA